MPIPARGASPYTAAALFSRMLATLSRPLRNRSGAPTLKISHSTRQRREKYLHPSFSTHLPDTMWEKRIPKLTIWLRLVAAAAPTIPRSNTKMRMGSRMQFTTAPATVPITDRRTFPSWRTTADSTKVAL